MKAWLGILALALAAAGIAAAAQSPALYGMLTLNDVRIPDPASASCFSGYCPDLNGDGIVNEIDLLGFHAQAGQCAPAAAYLSSLDADRNGCVEFCSGDPANIPDGENDCTKTNPSRDYACIFEWLGTRTSCNLIP
ncbi:MAG TPA: hypothetical protein VJC16_06270 [Candidatus Nanoarchaeia archaeon]|nr:hypothetical protein [Candidatus Nanoarchaeia archaeon]